MKIPTRVLVIGGTGYIGYHICLELVKSGAIPTALSIDQLPADFFPVPVKIITADLNNYPEKQLLELLQQFDQVVFAAGADDRLTPKVPAFAFFKKANVDSVARVLKLALHTRIKKVVILNSYFGYFNRLWPELKLAKNHPYIRSRQLQAVSAFQICGEQISVAIMELPYIVGTTPSKDTLWRPLIKYANSRLPFLIYSKGGTAVTSVGNVAEAVVSALERVQGHAYFQVVDINQTWSEFLNSLRPAGKKKLAVLSLPNWILKLAMFLLKLSHKLKGVEGGLDPVAFVDLQTRNTFIDVTSAKQKLQFGSNDIQKDFQDIIELVLPN